MAACGSGLATVDDHVSETNTYRTTEELIGAADLIVVGTVTEIEHSRYVEGGEDRTEIVQVAVTVEEVLTGDARVGRTVSFPFGAYIVNDDGERLQARRVLGVPLPEIDQELLLFLLDFPDDGASRADRTEVPSHYPPTSTASSGLRARRSYPMSTESSV